MIDRAGGRFDDMGSFFISAVSTIIQGGGSIWIYLTRKALLMSPSPNYFWTFSLMKISQSTNLSKALTPMMYRRRFGSPTPRSVTVNNPWNLSPLSRSKIFTAICTIWIMKTASSARQSSLSTASATARPSSAAKT